MEPLGNENLRKESMMSISVLRDYCLFQDLSLNSNGHASVFVLSSVVLKTTQKVKINKHQCNGDLIDLLAPGSSVHMTASTAYMPSICQRAWHRVGAQ